MRLIDADALMERIASINNPDMLTIGKVVGTIDTQPTAYDIDKVVEELEEKRKESILFQHEAELKGSIGNENYFGGKRNAYAESIEIVKQQIESEEV